jgi:hypothetical protein
MVEDDDEGAFGLGILHVDDKKSQHPNQVSACIIVNHANDDEQCHDFIDNRIINGVPLYTAEFSYDEILQLLFG